MPGEATATGRLFGNGLDGYTRRSFDNNPSSTATKVRNCLVGLLIIGAIAGLSYNFHSEISNLAMQHTFAFTAIATGAGIFTLLGLYKAAKKSKETEIYGFEDAQPIKTCKREQLVSIITAIGIVFSLCYFSSQIQDFLSSDKLELIGLGIGSGMTLGALGAYGCYYQHRNKAKDKSDGVLDLSGESPRGSPQDEEFMHL